MILPWKKYGAVGFAILVICALLVLVIIFSLFLFFPFGRIDYRERALVIGAFAVPTEHNTYVPVHIRTPDSLKAVYFTSWAAGNERFQKEMLDIVDSTEINAIVIDVKDYSGRISYLVEDPYLKTIGSAQDRIPRIANLLQELHKRNIYTIARISAFQDSYLINIHPEWAVLDKTGNVWKDYKGVKWLDPGSKPVWDYLTKIGKESYQIGFDEINFDYVRFPSDGDLSTVFYPNSNGRQREEVMESFYSYMHDQFASSSIPISVDLFGLTTSASDDLGIGQIIGSALQYFDYVYPMVYPSHFGHGFIGYEKPAEHPYEVIKYSMNSAVQKAWLASSSPQKIRPWLQAFDLGAIYTPSMVRAQVEAVYDSGLSSWLLWNAGSVYNKESLLEKDLTIKSKTEMSIGAKNSSK